MSRVRFMSPGELPVRCTRSGKIKIGCRQKNRLLPVFLMGTGLLTAVSLIYLQIPWLKLFSRVPDVGTIFWKLLHLDFSRWSLILSSLIETIGITVLSTFYGLVLGLVFGMLGAQNILHRKWLARFIQAFFTFLRAVPTPVWVLLMMVCLGMGPAAGIAGLCVHTTAFFTKSFSQSFESIPQETIEALQATGVGKLGIFLNAVLPSALAQVIAWVGMRFEINFSECAILGMVGAGGIGFVISKSIQGYEYGTAGVAILLVFLLAYGIERVFVQIKKKIR